LEYEEAILYAVAEASKQGVKLCRTAIQKIMYFSSVKGVVANTFVPYPFGPYSRDVRNTRESLVLLNFLEEDVVPYPGRYGYFYSLTDDGEELLSQIMKDYLKEFNKIKEIIAVCNKLNVLQDPDTLACAAKIHFILANQEKPMTIEDIRNQALRLEWDINDKQIEKAIELLSGLDLVETQ